MKTTPKICIIGDIVIDVSLKTITTELKMRLGGIVHAARSLWALDHSYSVAYFAPAYLDMQINDYLYAHGCTNVVKIGDVVGSPYVFLIEEAKESGSQGYEFLLRDNISVIYNEDAIKDLNSNGFSDFFLISGNYDLTKLTNILNGKIHIDAANNIIDLNFFTGNKRTIETLFISTSSEIFKNYYKNDFFVFCSLFKKSVKKVILKENRGGSRAIDLKTNEVHLIPAQPRQIAHSVGVGDVYDAVYINLYLKKTFKESLFYSSWVAAEYAVTTYVDDFKQGVSRIFKLESEDILNMPGILLPWEKRKDINVYIAAPDFTFVNTAPIDLIYNALLYHNFSPRRPVIENGQMEKNATKQRRQQLFNLDMLLLDKCSILIAVLLYNDPGTLIEIGLASARDIPIIVYDPYRQAENCMLTELPNLVSYDLDQIIMEVYLQAQIVQNGK